MDPLYYQAAAFANVTASPTITTTSQQIIGDNPARKGLMLYNNSSNTIYICYGPVANSSTKMSFQIASFQTWNMPSPIYTGVVSGIRNAGTGTVLATELT